MRPTHRLYLTLAPLAAGLSIAFGAWYLVGAARVAAGAGRDWGYVAFTALFGVAGVALGLALLRTWRQVRRALRAAAAGGGGPPAARR